MEEITEVNEKKSAVELCIKNLQADIENYSIAAEGGSDLCF